MESKIIKISDDQNEITHESGLVTKFKKFDNYMTWCSKCIYHLEVACDKAPCENRKDLKSGYFIKKRHEKIKKQIR